MVGTTTPQAATSGVSTNAHGSPRPPMLRKPTFATPMSVKSNTSPDKTVSSVKTAVSCAFKPLKQTAITHAASCSVKVKGAGDADVRHLKVDGEFHTDRYGSGEILRAR